jgi:hypothetical protein
MVQAIVSLAGIISRPAWSFPDVERPRFGTMLLPPGLTLPAFGCRCGFLFAAGCARDKPDYHVHIRPQAGTSPAHEIAVR